MKHIRSKQISNHKREMFTFEERANKEAALENFRMEENIRREVGQNPDAQAVYNDFLKRLEEHMKAD